MNNIFGMANLNPQKSGLGNVVIWSDHGGIQRKLKHNIPRIKLSAGDMSIVVSISDSPIVLSKSKSVSSRKKLSEFDDAIAYVARNNDIFMKHYTDVDFSFDDEDLYEALRQRGEYR